jgi:hypothetical protein
MDAVHRSNTLPGSHVWLTYYSTYPTGKTAAHRVEIGPEGELDPRFVIACATLQAAQTIYAILNAILDSPDSIDAYMTTSL